MRRSLPITMTHGVSRGAQLLLFLVIGNVYGASSTTDTVFTLYAPVVLIITVMTSAADVIVMPAIHKADRIQATGLLIRSLLRYAVLASIGLGIVVLPVYAWLTNTLNPQVVPILAFAIPIAGASAVITGLLQSRERFRRAALGPAYGALAALPVLALTHPSATTLAMILLAYECGRLAGLLTHAHKTIGGSVPSLADSASARQLILNSFAAGRIQALGSFLNALVPLAAILFAKSLGAGALTKVEYASRMWNIIPLLFTGPLLLAYSDFSQRASRGALEKGAVVRTMQVQGLAALVASVIAIALVQPLLQLLYQGGALEESARQELGVLLAFYLAASGPFVAALVYARALAAAGKVWPITTAAALAITAFTIITFLLMPTLGLNAIGMAFALTNAVAFFFLHLVSRPLLS